MISAFSDLAALERRGRKFCDERSHAPETPPHLFIWPSLIGARCSHRVIHGSHGEESSYKTFAFANGFALVYRPASAMSNPT
jgi:hypothetical protein